MRVISKLRLRQFWARPGQAASEAVLQAWYGHVNSKTVTWHSWADVKAEYASASIVGSCVVFNIGGNKYRLVVRIRYFTQKVFVLKVMTHEEYDDGKWKADCGCFAPPPKVKAQPEKTGPGNGKRRKR